MKSDKIRPIAIFLNLTIERLFYYIVISKNKLLKTQLFEYK